MNYLELLDAKIACLQERVESANEQAKGLEQAPRDKSMTNAEVQLLLIEFRAEMLRHVGTIRELKHEISKGLMLDADIQELTQECKTLQGELRHVDLSYMDLLEVVHQTEEVLPLLPTENQLAGCNLSIERNASGNLTVAVSYPKE